ncbi:MAG: serine/threonine-protein kinase [Proteobacteria bacterium]|nr:serine/threonine-protein kinase [Pseudomonadota bacterium]
MVRALGRYELLRPLARGGMAEVFLARRRAGGIEKLLVIKCIRPERSGDARFLEMFVREARLSMSLTHQNIVPVFDFGRSGEQVFLAMERVEGKDLGSSLARASGPLPPLVAAYIAAECCQALDYAHHRKAVDGSPLGVVHRDVTPRNVLVSWSGEVKLTDFGIAVVAGESTAHFVGTPAYMAPEQARGEPLDVRADLYALGMVLRELLTGTRARLGADRETLVASARSGVLEPWPTSTGPMVPDALRTIVERATASAAEDRFADAQAMFGELDAFIVAERATTSPASPTIKGSTPARQLATWLATTWEGAIVESAEPADDVLGFIGDVDAVGTGTERSLLATAADEPAVAPTEPAPVISSVGEAPTAPPTISSTIPPTIPLAPHRRTARIAIGIALAVTIGGLAIWRSAARDDAPGVPPLRVATVPTDAGVREAHDAAIDAAVVDAVPDALPDATIALDATVASRHRDDAPSRVTPDASLAVTTAPRRRVTVNALPWANFTVDGDPTSHQTIETIELTEGKHTLHFTNTQLGVTRDVDIEVPDHDLRYVEDLR